jgi:hypothetical protein
LVNSPFHKVFAVTVANPANILPQGGVWVVVMEERHSCRVLSHVS